MVSDRTDNRTLYFIVGGLLVAVIGIGIYNASTTPNTDTIVLTDSTAVPNEGSSMAPLSPAAGDTTPADNAANVTTTGASTGAITGTASGNDTSAPNITDQPMTDTSAESGTTSTTTNNEDSSSSSTTTTTTP